MHKVKAGFSLTESVVNILLVSMLFLTAIPVITTKVKSIQDWSDEDGQIWWETQPIGKGIYYNDNGTIGINVDNDFINETYPSYFNNKGIIIGSYTSEDDNSVIAYGELDPTLSSKTFTFDSNTNYIWDPEICAIGKISGGGTRTLAPFSFNEGSAAASYSVGASAPYSFRGSGDYSCEGSGDYSYLASGDYSVTIEGADATGSHSASVGNDESTCSISGDNAVLIGGDGNHASGGSIIGGHHLTSTGEGLILGGQSPYDWKEGTELTDAINNFMLEIANADTEVGLTTSRDSDYQKYYNKGKTLVGGYSNYAPNGRIIGGRLNSADADGTVIGGTLNNAGYFYKGGKTFRNKALIVGGTKNYASGGTILGGQKNAILGSSENSLIMGNRNSIGKTSTGSPAEYSSSFILGNDNIAEGNNILIIGQDNNIKSNSSASHPHKTFAIGTNISTNTNRDTFIMRFGSGTTSQLTSSGYTKLHATNISSDRRLKKNIEKLEPGLKEILKLNPVVFHYNNTPKDIKNGFIAQEIDKIFPEVINKSEKYWSVSYVRLYQKITLALINAYQEIFVKVTDLQKENKMLNKKLIVLKQKLDKLEGKRYE